jgi:hypothetical protein
MAAAINATITAWVRKRFITATDGSDSGTRPEAYGASDPHRMRQTYRSPAVVSMLHLKEVLRPAGCVPYPQVGFVR